LVGDQGGFLSEDDADTFSDLCLTLLTNETLYLQKYKEAFERAISFSSLEMAKRMAALYHSVIEIGKGNPNA